MHWRKTGGESMDNKTNPLVSLIIPNNNYARYLKQRLDSVFNQTYQNFEVILMIPLMVKICQYKNNQGYC
jgi:GT2 family glycosyltransferase